MWSVWLPSTVKAWPELRQAWTVLHFGQATQVPQKDTCLRGPKGVWYRQLSPGGSVTGWMFSWWGCWHSQARPC